MKKKTSPLPHTVFITGASSGIGKSLALEYAKKGYNLSLFARRKELLQELTKEIATLYPKSRTCFFTGNVTKKADLEEAINLTVKHFSRIDTVIANAGFGVSGPFSSLDIEDYKRQWETNVGGVLNTIKASLPYLKETKGRLAIMGSICSYISVPFASPYCMSKFSIRALAESLRFELKEKNISTTLICPGYITSEFRQVDNQGKLDKSRKDPIPKWLQQSANKAASSIAKSIQNRKNLTIITVHAKALYLMQRLFPFLLEKALFHISKKWANAYLENKTDR